MTYIRRFENFAPPPNDDPITTAAIEESSGPAGPGVELARITLSPVDPDPLHPILRDLSTNLATLPVGYYRIVWRDATDAQFNGAWIYFTDADTPPAYTASALDVASLMRPRLQGEYDEETTFTYDTRPTITMIESLIAQATGLIAPRIGFTIPDRLIPTAKSVVALQTALLVEPGYFAEQARPEKSAWDQWKQLLDDALEGLVAAIERDAQDGAEDGGPGTPVLPQYSFPECPRGTSLGEEF